MRPSFPIKSIVAALLMSTALPAQSQELAKEIVQEYFDQMEQGGMTVAPGPITVNGSTVEWKDIVVDLPNNTGSYTLHFIRATEIGDDKVEIVYPDKQTFTLPENGDVPAMTININSEGAKHVVSGVKGARNHAITTDMMNIQVTSSDAKLDVDFTLDGIVLNQNTTMKGTGEAAFLNYAGTIAVDSLNGKMLIAEPANNTHSAIDFTYNTFESVFDIDHLTEETMQSMMDGERNLSATMSIDSGTSEMNINDQDMAVLINTTSGLSETALSIKDSAFHADSTAKDVTYDIKLKDLPLPPFQATMATANMTYDMPLAQSATPQPLNIKMGLGGLTLSDSVWGMFDPTGALPRDAAKLNLDFTTQMKWLVNLLEQDGKMADIPMEFSTATLNDFTLEIAGAKFNGTGDAIIDNSSHVPMPVGVLNLDLKGGVTLVDTLVKIGILQQEQAQMAKMMAGMFSVPGGDGEDHLTSKIEMKEGGSIFANGQQLQ